MDKAKENCLVAVVGTKSDLVETVGRKVNHDVGQEVAKRENLKRNNYFASNQGDASSAFFETSSKTGENVAEVFQFLEDTLLARLKDNEPERETNTISVGSSKTQSRGGCC